MAPTREAVSPLLSTVLALIGDGATEADVDARLRTHGVVPAAGVSSALLGDAARLGLVRVGSTDDGGPRMVLTTLGTRLAAGARLDDDATDRLADLEELRTDLSATIAHELRTPLTVIRTSAGLLLSEDARPTPEQHRTLVETIERNADRMQRVVGDILDLARFRAGRIVLQRRRFDPVELADEAIASIAPVADGRGIHLELRGARPAPAVFGDRRRLEQALVNLVSNAVRFSPTGGRVTITVTIDPRGDGTRWAGWSVRDDGPGIAEDDQRRLFERFFVGRSDVNGPRDGVGLGLPTARAIADAHGGRIEVDSRPGAGSTFRLVVPLDGPADLQETG